MRFRYMGEVCTLVLFIIAAMSVFNSKNIYNTVYNCYRNKKCKLNCSIQYAYTIRNNVAESHMPFV